MPEEMDQGLRYWYQISIRGKAFGGLMLIFEVGMFLNFFRVCEPRHIVMYLWRGMIE